MKSIIFAAFILALAGNAAAQQTPIIDHLTIDDPTGRLTIFGSFGSGPGTVTVDSVAMLYSLWTSDSIVCSIPDTGKGSCGPVQVLSSSGASNERLLSAWDINWSYAFLSPYYDGGENIQLRFRLDLISALRSNPIMEDSTDSSTTTETYIGPGNNDPLTSDTTIRGSRLIEFDLNKRVIDLEFQAGEVPREATVQFDSRFNIYNSQTNIGPHENIYISGASAFIPPDSELYPSSVESTASSNIIQGAIYPQPASTNAFIRYNLTEMEQVSLSLYDITGHEIEEVITNALQSAGPHTIPIDVRRLSCGTYFVHIQTEKYFDVIKFQVICN